MRCAVLMLLFLAYSCIVSARQSPDLYDVQHTSQRALQQASTSNCTPPRTAEDTKKPFCFVPETISAQARQFLSQSAAGNAFGGITFSTDPRQQALAVAQLRPLFEGIGVNETKAAMAKYIQSTRNGTIGGVPVMYAVPKGVKATLPANTKVLLYLHGRFFLLKRGWHRVLQQRTTWGSSFVASSGCQLHSMLSKSTAWRCGISESLLVLQCAAASS